MKSQSLWPILTLTVVAIGSAALCMADSASSNTVRDIKIWGGLSSKPSVSEYYHPDQARIGIGSFEMFAIHRAAAGFSIAEREVVVYNRLVEILSSGPVNADAVSVRQVRSAPTVYVGPYRLVSVYRQDAAAAGVSQRELARRWAQGVAETLPQVAPANAVAK